MNEEQKRQLELQLLQQHMEELQNQLQSLKNQLAELTSLRQDLDHIEQIKNKKSLVPLGAGIFIESDIKEVKDVLLNIGANIIVKKDINTAKKILDKQIKDLEKIASQLENSLIKGYLQFSE
jgi:prefoldin alpha subunit